MYDSIVKTCVLFIVSLCFVALPLAHGKIIYVDDDATGLGNGSSWTDAYRYLQDALADANNSEKPVEIRVSQGVYKPDTSSAHPDGTGDRTASFYLIDEVAIKGGFGGIGAADPNVRNIALYETILSGDLAGDDALVRDPCDLMTEPTRTENSCRIVTARACSRSAILDGFTISSGSATAAQLRVGAGLFLSLEIDGTPCCPSIRNCTFVDNSAAWGGAVYVIGARPELINCAFLRNTATLGGAIYTDLGRIAPPKTCDFPIRGCMFAGNCARETGGAIYIEHGPPSVIEDSNFTRNSAKRCGAVYIASPIESANIMNCRFIHNMAAEAGGAIYFMYENGFRMTSCTFFNNVAQIGNAIACLESLSAVAPAPSATITNTILWDGGEEIGIGEHVQMSVTYSDIQSGWPGEGNIDVDPLFANPDNSDHHLKSQTGRWDPTSESWIKDDVTSPCIDTGDPNSPIGLEPFPNGGRINMGAYGGTAEASKSYFGEPVCETIVAGDINGDCRVDFRDLQIMAGHWLQEQSE